MFLNKNLPKKVAEAPRVIKRIEKPRINIRELAMTFFRTFFKLFC